MTATNPGDLLGRIEAALASAAIDHMVVGSFASSVHGFPRTTHDLDVVIDPTLSQLEAFVLALDPERYYVDADVARDAFLRRGMFNVIDMETGWKVDLILRKARPFSVEELKRRIVVSIFGIDAPLATAEDTIIAKLEWAREGGSERQLDDVVGILRVRGASLDGAYIERWVAELHLGELWHQVVQRA